jgi:hypothetical protein
MTSKSGRLLPVDADLERVLTIWPRGTEVIGGFVLLCMAALVIAAGVDTGSPLTLTLGVLLALLAGRVMTQHVRADARGVRIVNVVRWVHLDWADCEWFQIGSILTGFNWAAGLPGSCVLVRRTNGRELPLGATYGPLDDVDAWIDQLTAMRARYVTPVSPESHT